MCCLRCADAVTSVVITFFLEYHQHISFILNIISIVYYRSPFFVPPYFIPITLPCPPSPPTPPFSDLRLRRMSRKFSGQVIIMVPLIMLFFWRNLSFDNLSRNFLFIMNYYNLVQNIFGKKEGKKSFVSPCNFEIFPILPNLLRPTESFKGLKRPPRY